MIVKLLLYKWCSYKVAEVEFYLPDETAEETFQTIVKSVKTIAKREETKAIRKKEKATDETKGDN